MNNITNIKSENQDIEQSPPEIAIVILEKLHSKIGEALEEAKALLKQKT